MGLMGPNILLHLYVAKYPDSSGSLVGNSKSQHSYLGPSDWVLNKNNNYNDNILITTANIHRALTMCSMC